MSVRGGGKVAREIVASALVCLLAGLTPTAAGAMASGGAETVDRASARPPATTASLDPPTDLRAAEPFRLAPSRADDRFAHKWREVSVAIAADRAVLAACRIAPAGCPEAARRFGAVVAQAEAETGRARLGHLNRAINLAITYTSDLVQHGRDDVWSSPLATFASRMGDCEDYAIAKYVALLEAGVAQEDLRVVVVDERWSGLHAVASVRLDGAWLVLDNRRMALIEDRDVAGYRAVATFDGRATSSVVVDSGVARTEPPGPSGVSEPAS